MKQTVSVLGGDPRQLCLAELFREEGHRVHTWGLAPPETEPPLEEAASRTKFLPVDHPLIQTARDAGTTFGD